MGHSTDPPRALPPARAEHVGDIEVNTLRGHPRPRRAARVPHLPAPRLRPARSPRERLRACTPSTSPTTPSAPATSCGCAPARSTSGARSTTSRAPSRCSARTPSTTAPATSSGRTWSAPETTGPPPTSTATPVLQALDLAGIDRHRPTGPPKRSRPAPRRSRPLPRRAPRLARARRTGRRRRCTGPTHEAYGWFRDHIEEHFRSWHKVSEYADRLGYSTRTLNRLARQHTGLSAKELIDERVVLEAKRQLSHADASVSEIAEQLGFDDASNFSSYFRRQTSTTPGAFRALG